MPNFQAKAFAKLVDAVEPIQHAVEKFHSLPVFFEPFVGNVDALLLGFVECQHHVGQNVVHLVLVRIAVTFAPKLVGSHAKRRDEAKFLHVLGGKSVVEVVDKCNNWFFHSNPPNSPRCREKTSTRGGQLLSNCLHCYAYITTILLFEKNFNTFL